MKLIPGTMLATALAALVFTGCKKDEVESPTTPVTPVTGIASLGSFFSSQGAQSQNFTINNNSQQVITGAQGTIVTFSANSFVTMSGAPVTGTVNIELKEIYDKKNMLLSNMTTNAEQYPNGPVAPLTSGGEIYVNATQGNAQLKLAPGQTYQAFLPSSTAPVGGMSLFVGKTVANGILWSPSQDSLSAGVTPSAAPQGYFMSCDSLHWGNADMFVAPATFTSITLNVAGTFDPAQIRAYEWFDNYKTIWAFSQGINANGTACIDQHSVAGLNVHLVVISVKNGKLYTAILPTTVTTNGVYNVTLAETTETAFSNALSALQ